MTKTEKTTSILIALTAFVLMQVHSIEYWVAMTDEIRGIAFSVALEAAALWLWYSKGIIHRVFSVAASAIVIFSALFSVSAPHFDRWHNATNNSAMIESLQNEIRDHQSTLKQIEDNSGKRSGWAGLLRETREDLSVARSKLREELAVSAEVQMDWRTWAGVGIQALALLVVMVAQILAVVSLRSGVSNSPKKFHKIAVEETFVEEPNDIAASGLDRPLTPESEAESELDLASENQTHTKSNLTFTEINEGIDLNKKISTAIVENQPSGTITESPTKESADKPFGDDFISASPESEAEMFKIAGEAVRESAATAKKASESFQKISVTAFDLRVKAVADKIRERLPLFENKQIKLAESLSIPIEEISMALNHLSLKVAKKPVIGAKELVKLEEIFDTA